MRTTVGSELLPKKKPGKQRTYPAQRKETANKNCFRNLIFSQLSSDRFAANIEDFLHFVHNHTAA